MRFNPGESAMVASTLALGPPEPDFEGRVGRLRSSSPSTRGIPEVHARDTAWGFAFENGDPVFIFGDTTYHLFGMAHNSDKDAEAVHRFLARRAEQGFNLLRIRLPVSRISPRRWLQRLANSSLWPWRGSPQSPRFGEFNLDYFRTVDHAWSGMSNDSVSGIEMILEAWGLEFPFNNRNVFTAAWEDLWIRYMVARYDAFNAVGSGNSINEYEYYPNGDWHYKPVADRWQMRISRGSRRTLRTGTSSRRTMDRDCHPSPSASPPIRMRSTRSCTRSGAPGIRKMAGSPPASKIRFPRASPAGPVQQCLRSGDMSAIPSFSLKMPGHGLCDVDHTRRGAWRGAFQALGVIHGFENSWGPWAVLEEDQPGLDDLLQVRRFFTEILPFADLRPAPDLILGDGRRPGRRPLAMTTRIGPSLPPTSRRVGRSRYRAERRV